MSTERITLTNVYSADTNKEGKKYQGKHKEWCKEGCSDPHYFWRVGIKTNEYGEEWLNGFSNDKPTYKEGDTIEVEVSETEWNGKRQKNFKIPNKNAQLAAKVEELEARVNHITNVLNQLTDGKANADFNSVGGQNKTSGGVEYPQEEINADDIPF